jgi:hypothetical protein
MSSNVHSPYSTEVKIRSFALGCAVVLGVTYSHAQDEKRTRSIEQDKVLLTAMKWQNEKPETAWNKLSYVHKEQLGGKPWKKVELEITKLGDSPDPEGRTYRAQLSFLKPDDEKFSFGPASVEIREENGKRLLVVTNLDKVEYKIEYEFIGNKLRMRGSYLRREPSSGAIFIPEVFDGDYVPISLTKNRDGDSPHGHPMIPPAPGTFPNNHPLKINYWQT